MVIKDDMPPEDFSALVLKHRLRKTKRIYTFEVSPDPNHKDKTLSCLKMSHSHEDVWLNDAVILGQAILARLRRTIWESEVLKQASDPERARRACYRDAVRMMLEGDAEKVK